MKVIQQLPRNSIRLENNNSPTINKKINRGRIKSTQGTSKSPIID